MAHKKNQKLYPKCRLHCTNDCKYVAFLHSVIASGPHTYKSGKQRLWYCCVESTSQLVVLRILLILLCVQIILADSYRLSLPAEIRTDTSRTVSSRHLKANDYKKHFSCVLYVLMSAMLVSIFSIFHHFYCCNVAIYSTVLFYGIPAPRMTGSISTRYDMTDTETHSVCLHIQSRCVAV